MANLICCWLTIGPGKLGSWFGWLGWLGSSTGASNGWFGTWFGSWLGCPWTGGWFASCSCWSMGLGWLISEGRKIG